MAEKGTGSASHAGVRVADNLYIVEVALTDLKEQDVNARVMPPRQFERLVENIKSRGALESLAYCAQPGGSGPIEIVSGHHRLRAAGAAGLKKVHVLVDVSPLTRSQIVAKQLAHNALAGHDDPDVMKQLIGFIDNPDDLAATGLPDEQLMGPDRDDLQLFAPHVDFEQRTVTFAFLPHQRDEIERLAQKIADSGKKDLVLTADGDQFDAFLRAAAGFARINKVLSAPTAITLLVRLALEALDAEEEGQADGTSEDPESGDAAPVLASEA